MISASPTGAGNAWINDSLEALRQPYNPTHDPIREIDLRHVMDSLPDESRELLEEYINSIHSGDAATQLKKMLEGIAGSSGLSSATISAIGIRVVALLWALQSQKWDLCGMSLTEIGRQIGKTKADVSHWVKRNGEDFGIHARGQKMLESSETYKMSALEGWETRRNNQQGKITETERKNKEHQRTLQLIELIKKINQN